MLAKYLNILQSVIHGDKSNYQIIQKFYRYHPVMSIGHRKTYSIHVLDCCDYNRASAIFGVSDIYYFVGANGNAEVTRMTDS